jgi:phosphoglycolate phosphatase-like HAD superfamily hydrolase
MEKTDITGARKAGMRAILYTGVSNSSAGDHHADVMFDNWHDITDYLLGN